MFIYESVSRIEKEVIHKNKESKLKLYAAECSAKILYRKLGKNISRQETARPQSQFLHSYIC